MKRIRLDPNLLRLYRYFLPQKAKLAFASVFLLVSASTSSVTATLLGLITDASFYTREGWVVYGAPLALIGVTLGYAVSEVASAYLMAKVSQNVLVALRTQMFERILHWPDAAYQDHATGRICSKFVNEAMMALSGAAQSFIILVRDTVQAVALLGVLFWHDWKLTLVTFVIIPGLAFTLVKISRRVRKVVAANQEMLGGMISRVQESFDAQQIIKVSGTYDFEEKRFAGVNDQIKRLSLKLIKLQSISTPITQILTMVAIACVVAVALIEAKQGMLTIGQFVTFLSAMLMIKVPIQHLAGLNGTFASISAAANSIFETMDAEIEKDEGKKTLERVEGAIAFEHVVLAYPGQESKALDDVTFEIAPGAHVAIVGPSGSGKTSLVNLLPRFLEPTSGRVTIDGVPLSELTLENLRSHIAFVTQDVVIFDDTIRNNLTYGMPEVSEEKLARAVHAAALDDFVASLPKGLDTQAGENGNLLSGGQKQRLSIARAFLKDAPILIMDEATSALDAKTEKEVTEALDALRKDRTCITVAHRFATIAGVDEAVVLIDGHVVEKGTPAELLELNGTFARLYRLQQTQA